MKKVKVIFPDKSIVELDEADVPGALKAGAKLYTGKAAKTVAMAFPDGSEVDIDEQDVDGAMSAGAVKKKDEISSAPLQPVSGTSANDIPQSGLQSQLGLGSTMSAAAGVVKNIPTDLASTQPSMFDEEKKTIFDVPFLDRDIEKKFDLSLSNPALSKPASKYSLLNDYYKKKQTSFDARKETAKTDIKKDVGTLATYNTERITEINTDIATANQRLKELNSSLGGAESMSVDELMKITDEQAELKKQIAHAQDYKGKLKSSVASESVKKIVPDYIGPGKQFDAAKLGRDILKVADPEMELQYQDAEKGNSGLPQLQSASIERLGLDAAKSYLSTQPQTEEVVSKLNEIAGQENSFDERNFELTAQRVREKLGVYFYNKGKSGVFGYKGKDIEKAINDPQADLTDNEKKIALNYVLPLEKKLSFSTEIPGSGFFRSGKDAIERSVVGMGNTISSLIGTRSDPERAYENLNAEIEQSRFARPGENPSMKAELGGLNKKEIETGLTAEEKKRKLELDKLVDVRGWVEQLRDGMGDLTGQVIQMALLTKGVGGIGKIATGIAESGGVLSGGLTSSAIGIGLSNETTGLFLNSFFQTYDNYRSQALELMPGDKNIGNRQAYAVTMAAVEGFSERIFNDVKVLDGFTKGIAPSIAGLTTRFINKEITGQVAKEELRSAFMKYAKPYAKSFIKSEFEESFEEGIVDIADGVSQSVFGGQPFDINKTGEQAINTFLTTALYSPLVSGMASHGAARQNASERAFYKAAIVDMARNPIPYLKSVDQLVLSGTITQEQANEKVKLINSAQTYLKELPAMVVTPNQDKKKGGFVLRQLDFPEVSSYMTHRLNEGVLTAEQEKVKNDPVAVKNLQTQIDRSVAIRQGIADGQIGITPNSIEVTDDEKKAKELGISTPGQVNPDDLIGTRFEPKAQAEDVKHEEKPIRTPEGTATPIEKPSSEDQLAEFAKERKAVNDLYDEDWQDKSDEEQASIQKRNEDLGEQEKIIFDKYATPEEKKKINQLSKRTIGEKLKGNRYSASQRVIDYREDVLNRITENISQPKTQSDATKIHDTGKANSTPGQQTGTEAVNVGDQSTRQQQGGQSNEIGSQAQVLTTTEGAVKSAASSVNPEEQKQSLFHSRNTNESVYKIGDKYYKQGNEQRDKPVEISREDAAQMAWEHDGNAVRPVVPHAERMSVLEKYEQRQQSNVGEVNDAEYNDFIDKGKVSDERLNDIAGKVKNQEPLSDREKEIFTDKTSEINKIIAAKPKGRLTADQLEEQMNKQKAELQAAQPVKEPVVEKPVKKKSNRQTNINNLRDRVDSFNKMPGRSKNRKDALDELRSDAEALGGLSIDFKIGKQILTQQEAEEQGYDVSRYHTVLRYSAGGNVQRRSSQNVGKVVQAAGTKRLYNDIGNIDVPTTAQGLALHYIATGGSVSETDIDKEVAGTVKGPQLNMGLQEERSSEVRARDYATENGPTIKQIAHSIWEEQTTDQQDKITDQDIQNALIDVMQTHNTRLAAAKEFASKYGEKVTGSKGLNLVISESFDPATYSQTTQDAVNRILAEPLLLSGLALKGDDGYRLTFEQQQDAIQALKDGNATVGSKAIYDFFENAVNGEIAIEDLTLGREELVSIDDYFAVNEAATAATDDDLDNINTRLTENAFNDTFDEVFDNVINNENEPEKLPAERVNPPGKTEQAAAASAEQNQKDNGDNRGNADANKASEKTGADKVKSLSDKLKEKLSGNEQAGQEEPADEAPFNAKNVPDANGPLQVLESRDYVNTGDNNFRPDQQLKFNQGDNYAPVRIIADPEMIELISIGAKINKQITTGVSQNIPRQTQKELEAKFGMTAMQANKNAKELAKQNRDAKIEKIIVLGVKPTGFQVRSGTQLPDQVTTDFIREELNNKTDEADIKAALVDNGYSNQVAQELIDDTKDERQITEGVIGQIGQWLGKIFGGKQTVFIAKDQKTLLQKVNSIVGNVSFRLTNAVFETRDGKPIGFNYDTDQVARERFDFSKMTKIGEGSDRVVFDMGDGNVLKVAKTARGLEQNITEGQWDLVNQGILPEVKERGLNYIVAKKVTPVKTKAEKTQSFERKHVDTGEVTITNLSEMVADFEKFNQYDFDRSDKVSSAKRQSELQAMLDKYDYRYILNNNVIWGDWAEIKNWGLDENGQPVHLDGGTFGTVASTITAYRGKKNLDDSEFRDIYNKSRALKKQYADTDKFTMFQGKLTNEQQAVVDAQKEVDKAKRDLQKAESKIAATQSQQTEIGEVKQGAMFGVNRDEAKAVLDPLRQNVREAQERLDEANKNLPKESGQQGTLFMKAPTGDILGFTSNGKIYLNGAKLNPETPIHEAGHIWTEWAIDNARDLYDRGRELIKNSKYLAEVKASPFYQSEANKLPASEREKYYEHEAIATAIGDKGAQFISDAKKKGFAAWAKELWDRIGKALGFKNILPDELANLTLDEFAQRAAIDILKADVTPRQSTKVKQDDVIEVAKDIRADRITMQEAIKGKDQKFIDALNKELKGSARANLDLDALRVEARRMRDFGMSKEDVIAHYAGVKKITTKMQDVLDEVFLENAVQDKQLEELREAMRSLAKGIKPKKVLQRLSASDVTSLVLALKDRMTYAAVSNKQMEEIVDYILDTINLDDIQDYLASMHYNGLADTVQLLRAKAIVELQKAGKNAMAKELVRNMADDAITAGRQTQSLKRAYEILRAKGNAAMRTEFARRYAQKVQEAATKMNQRMKDVISDKQAEIDKLNQKIHDQIHKQPGILGKLKNILDKICGVRRKK